MYRCPCPGCPKTYLSQREADLCTPEKYWADRYPSTVDQKITDQNSVFLTE